MRRSSLSGRPSSTPLLRRIERAAGEMNPYLAVVAIGLVLVNLIVLAALSPQLRVTRLSEVPAVPAEAGAILTSAGAATASPPPIFDHESPITLSMTPSAGL